ncbi:hypothetical protein Droror1_Dr00015033 [Drosera rotundifolia]
MELTPKIETTSSIQLQISHHEVDTSRTTHSLSRSPRKSYQLLTTKHLKTPNPSTTNPNEFSSRTQAPLHNLISNPRHRQPHKAKAHSNPRHRSRQPTVVAVIIVVIGAQWLWRDDMRETEGDSERCERKQGQRVCGKDRDKAYDFLDMRTNQAAWSFP